MDHVAKKKEFPSWEAAQEKCSMTGCVVNRSDGPLKSQL